MKNDVSEAEVKNDSKTAEDKIGKLPDGRSVSLHPTNSDGRPVLETYDKKNKKKIKIHYGEK